MINIIKNIYSREMFNPSAIGLFINPFYFARKGLFKNISELTHFLYGSLLDVGCGTKPYESICPVQEYIGLEIDDGEDRNHKLADALYDGNKMPFLEKRFDSVMTNQVFEHVFNPSEFLSEINRVTKVGGLLLLSVPFVWDEHEQPFDYARYSSFGLKHILEINGFEVIEARKSSNGVEVLFQLINAYIYKVTRTRNFYLNSSVMLFFMAPVNILGAFLSKILPRNNDLYLDNIVLAKKVRDV